MIQQHRLLCDLARLVDGGIPFPTANEHFGAIQAANLRRAHALLESGTARGKIVLDRFGAVCVPLRLGLGRFAPALTDAKGATMAPLERRCRYRSTV